MFLGVCQEPATGSTAREEKPPLWRRQEWRWTQTGQLCPSALRALREDTVSCRLGKGSGKGNLTGSSGRAPDSLFPGKASICHTVEERPPG